jgi:hypothetical protein
MKVKFYKGPYHGKTKDHQIMDFNHPIIIQAMPKHFNFHSLPAGLDTAIQYDRHIYRVQLMRVQDSTGKYYQAPAMHPDGSIYYVYEGKN